MRDEDKQHREEEAWIAESPIETKYIVQFRPESQNRWQTIGRDWNKEYQANAYALNLYQADSTSQIRVIEIATSRRVQSVWAP